MAGTIPNDQKDLLVSAFRERVCERYEVAPLVHQRKWWCAADGLILLENVEDPNGVTVKLPTGDVVRMGVAPRPHGRAKVIADLGAFKSGKSFGTALWASGFGFIPDARITLVGAQYSIVEPEFNYILEFLCSGRGMGLKYKSLANSPQQGNMQLELENGCKFEAKSWERKDALKGKEIDAYIFCEAYQLPGIECYTAVRQNLVAREGYAVFPTTPDRPWLKEIHDKGHGTPGFEEWECICDVPRNQNPYTYSLRDESQDRELLTKEKFQIAHFGQMGDFVGRVFNYSRGSREFTAATHPELFREGTNDRSGLTVPEGWEIVAGADTGTFYAAVIMAFSPNGDAFVLEEFPNYRYVGGEPERDESLSIPRWANGVSGSIIRLGGSPNLWADPNSQFKAELRNYGLFLMPAKAPVETRTEITREYFEHNRIWLAPWLQVVPWELENASWPDEASLAGKFARVKRNDHSLDPIEHICARRPLGRRSEQQKKWGSWLNALRRGSGKSGAGNVHLGTN